MFCYFLVRFDEKWSAVNNPVKVSLFRSPTSHHYTFTATHELDCLIGPVKQKNLAWNWDYFLIHQFKHVFWVLRGPSHLDGSFEYPQHMFWLRKQKIIFSYTLIWGPVSAFSFAVVFWKQCGCFLIAGAVWSPSDNIVGLQLSEKLSDYISKQFLLHS